MILAYAILMPHWNTKVGMVFAQEARDVKRKPKKKRV